MIIFMKFDERNKKKIKIPTFLFPWQLRQSLSYWFRFFFGLSRSTRCGCDRKHYCKTLWSLEWNKKKMHLGYHGKGRHFEFFQPPKLPHTTVDILTKFHEVWWKESPKNLNPPFFVSMATVVKFAQPIPILLAYFVPLDVDAVPIKLHQFLFGE